jgi:hypothetical protein
MLIDKIEFESEYYTETSHGITGEYESCPHTMELYASAEDEDLLLAAVNYLNELEERL